MKSLTPRKPPKDQREKSVLFGLIELYLQIGKPIGSNTMREQGFCSLSSATIRNYFMKLEEEGFLRQQHSSGGRIPTSAAYKLYALDHQHQATLPPEDAKQIARELTKQTREVATYLLRATEKISEITQCAVFLSAPRFDQDFILDIKLVLIDPNRILCVLITDFGLIRTEILPLEKKLSLFTLKQLESYFNWKLTGIDKPSLEPEEEVLGSQLYKEVMIRHIVSYTHFSSEDLFQAGFSRLLAYADFNDASALASGLSLFENKQMLKKLLSTTSESGSLQCWIGEDLIPFAEGASACTVLSVPYKIHQTTCGALGILGPTRLPYKELFGKLTAIQEALSTSLTQSVYKFKLSFRTPKSSSIEFKHSGFLEESPALLLEDRSFKDLL